MNDHSHDPRDDTTDNFLPLDGMVTEGLVTGKNKRETTILLLSLLACEAIVTSIDIIINLVKKIALWICSVIILLLRRPSVMGVDVTSFWWPAPHATSVDNVVSSDLSSACRS